MFRVFKNQVVFRVLAMEYYNSNDDGGIRAMDIDESDDEFLINISSDDENIKTSEVTQEKEFQRRKFVYAKRRK